MSRIPDFLVEPRSPLKAIALGWPMATLPALVLAFLAGSLVGADSQPSFGTVNGLVVFAIVVVAPVIETLIMALALEVLIFLLARLKQPQWFAIPLSALGWAIAHSLQAPAWGLVIWWPFLIFSALYMAWRKRSYAWALAIPMAVHALNNAIPALLLLRNG